MNHRQGLTVAGIALGALIASNAVAVAFPGQALSPPTTVTITRARAIATHIVPGTVISQELEKETGGSGLRYSFVIKGAHGLREVGIDAKTAALLENSSENASTAPQLPEKDESPEGSGD